MELGGKCPCIVDETADLDWVCRRVINGRFVNSGQICVALEYLMVSNKIKDKLVNMLLEMLPKIYPENDQSDYGKIINEFHFNRLVKTME